jgi:DNA-binding NarL/FixJ family response regulator
MDDVTREAIEDVLQRALERIQRAAQTLAADSSAARELGVAERLIEAALHAADSDDDRANDRQSSGEVDAPYRRDSDDELLPMPALTMREEEVLDLMSQGLRNKEIAARLGVTERTATFHVGNVLAKLGADGRVEAIHFARKRGLI